MIQEIESFWQKLGAAGFAILGLEPYQWADDLDHDRFPSDQASCGFAGAGILFAFSLFSDESRSSNARHRIVGQMFEELTHLVQEDLLEVCFTVDGVSV